MGLGFAATRDVISFLRYEITDSEGTPNPLMSVGLPNIAISLGVSQSGRFLRDMLYLGFNEDVGGRIVFDGMHPNIAGFAEDVHELSVRPTGTMAEAARGPLLPGGSVPIYLWDRVRPDQ